MSNAKAKDKGKAKAKGKTKARERFTDWNEKTVTVKRKGAKR